MVRPFLLFGRLEIVLVGFCGERLAPEARTVLGCTFLVDFYAIAYLSYPASGISERLIKTKLASWGRIWSPVLQVPDKGERPIRA